MHCCPAGVSSAVPALEVHMSCTAAVHATPDMHGWHLSSVLVPHLLISTALLEHTTTSLHSSAHKTDTGALAGVSEAILTAQHGSEARHFNVTICQALGWAASTSLCTAAAFARVAAASLASLFDDDTNLMSQVRANLMDQPAAQRAACIPF